MLVFKDDLLEVVEEIKKDVVCNIGNQIESDIDIRDILYLFQDFETSIEDNLIDEIEVNGGTEGLVDRFSECYEDLSYDSLSMLIEEEYSDIYARCSYY